MIRFPIIRAARGQAAMETLLVLAFTIIFSLLVILPYVTNQNLTNASLNTKSAILPYLDSNTKNVKISQLQPTVNASNALVMEVYTLGEWDATTSDTLTASGCAAIHDQIDPNESFSSVRLDWYHNQVLFCSIS